MTTNDTDAPQKRPRRIDPIPPFSSRHVRFNRVHVAETEGRGLGVFADAPVKRGRAVGRVLGDLKPVDFRSCYCVEFAGAVLEPNEPYRFLNHSCDPNCEFIEWEIEDQFESVLGEAPKSQKTFELWLHALRDVQKGEELTIDYGWSWQFAIPCKCGSPLCRGWICRLDELDICLQNRGAPNYFVEEQS